MQKFALKLSSFMGDLSKFLFIQDAKLLYSCAQNEVEKSLVLKRLGTVFSAFKD